jgi:hypothetical protein
VSGQTPETDDNGKCPRCGGDLASGLHGKGICDTGDGRHEAAVTVLDGMAARLWTRALIGDDRALQRTLEIQNRRATLFGLDWT